MSKYRDIPAGAIKVAIPASKQPESYCGPSSLYAIAAAYGIAPESVENIAKGAGTTIENGTYYGKLAEYAKSLGFDVEVRQKITKEELKKILDEGAPVIISFQAWGDPADYYDDTDSFSTSLGYNINGHFAVVVGYDDEDCFYFMDPSQWDWISYLPWSELDKRWHENEGIESSEFSDHLGIICRPGKDQAHVYLKRAKIIE